MPRGVYPRRRRVSPATRQVWIFVAEYLDQHGYAPSQREIAAGCFMALSAVGQALLRLELRGVLETDEGVTRGIRLLEKP